MAKTLQIGDLTAKVPVIQGGMGIGVSLSGLAGAVAACGGVGVISAAQIGFREPDFAENPRRANLRALKAEIEKARALARGGIIGVNIMVAMRYYEDYVKAACEAGADLIISGAGLPVNLPSLAKGSRTKLAPIVSSLKSAAVLLKLWDRKEKRMPDLLVIEGPLAGGHLGFSEETLNALEAFDFDREIREILEHRKQYEEKYRKKIPVAVAGGIYTGADAAHALSLGADAIQAGTRFVTTEECDASAAYKETYLRAKKEDIQIVKSPVGMPGRAIRNRFLQNQEKKKITHCYGCLSHCNPAEIPYCITRALIEAVEGNTGEGLLFCGSNAWRAERIQRVSEVMEEFEQAIKYLEGGT